VDQKPSVSTQQQTKNTEDRIQTIRILVLYLTGFKRWKKVPFGKACKTPKKLPKSSSPFSEGQCARFPFGCNSLEIRRAEFVRKLPQGEASLRKWLAYLWSSEEFSLCCFVAPVVQAKATSQQSFS
jgi:hypothetical protein